LAVTRVDCRDHVRLPVDSEAQVTNQAFIQDRIDRWLLVDRAFRPPLDCNPDAGRPAAFASGLLDFHTFVLVQYYNVLGQYPITGSDASAIESSAERAIIAGTLGPGDRPPTVRAL